MEAQIVRPLQVTHVVVNGFALVKSFEEALDAVYADKALNREVLVIDFSDVTFIEPPTLQHLIAVTLARKRAGLQTMLKLPSGDTGPRVRDFLRRWKFAAGLTDVTGIRFVDFVVDSDHRYFKGLGGDKGVSHYSGGITKITLADDGNDSAPRFFPFTTWDLNQYLEAARVSDEALDNWSNELVLAVLDRHLQQKDSDATNSSTSSGMYVASRIVFEAMTNAIRHPGASFIQSSSVLHTSRADGQASDAHFSATFWDDGTSMAATLKAAIDRHLVIRYPHPSALITRYRLNAFAADGSKVEDEALVTSTDDLGEATPTYRLLLATIFPGVTCDVTGTGLRVHKELVDSEPALATQGMGLFALIRTTIDKFDGAVAFRTGPYFMSVKRARRGDREARYRVKILTRPDTTPTFLGNMITIRLPLK